MKDLIFYDHRHGNAVVVKNPKSRNDAWKYIWAQYVPQYWDSTTWDDIDDFIDATEMTEVDEVIEIKCNR